MLDGNECASRKLQYSAPCLPDYVRCDEQDVESLCRCHISKQTSFHDDPDSERNPNRRNFEDEFCCSGFSRSQRHFSVWRRCRSAPSDCVSGRFAPGWPGDRSRRYDQISYQLGHTRVGYLRHRNLGHHHDSVDHDCDQLYIFRALPPDEFGLCSTAGLLIICGGGSRAIFSRRNLFTRVNPGTSAPNWTCSLLRGTGSHTGRSRYARFSGETSWKWEPGLDRTLGFSIPRAVPDLGYAWSPTLNSSANWSRVCEKRNCGGRTKPS